MPNKKQVNTKSQVSKQLSNYNKNTRIFIICTFNFFYDYNNYDSNIQGIIYLLSSIIWYNIVYFSYWSPMLIKVEHL